VEIIHPDVAADAFEILAGITTGITNAAKRPSRPATTLKQPRRSSSHDAQAATTLKPLSTIKFEEEPVWFVFTGVFLTASRTVGWPRTCARSLTATDVACAGGGRA
jgi:hypothetical protein